MFLKPPESLRLQLLCWLLIPLVLLLLVNAWFSNRIAVSTANLAFDRLLEASAEAISEDVDTRDGEIVVDLPYAALQLLESNIQERIFYRVVGPDGKTITGYEDLPLPIGLAATSEVAAPYTALYRGEPIHLVALNKQMYGTRTAAPVVVIVAETGEARYALSHQILVEGLTSQTLLIASAGLLVWFGLLRGLQPLRNLTRALGKREPTDLGPIDASKVQLEVRPLIVALNQHTARIERLLASQRRLITDASHQMRTPLSEMRVQIDYSLRQDDPALLRQTLGEVHGDIDRLARLIGQLLLLARADPEILQDQRIDAVDLASLARSVALDCVPAARRKSIDLSFEPPSAPAVVRGNALLLREVLANLIDNAIAHGRTRGTVAVRILQEPETVLEILDDGPGISAAERDQVFERFYRGAGAAAGGSGLGLSIVRDICLAHRAHVALSTPPSGTGLRVRIVFQTAVPAPA